MSTSTALASAQARQARLTRSRPARRSRVGAGAGLLVLALLAGSVAGAVWGALRPGYEVLVRDGDVIVDQVASPPSVEFASYAWFALLAGILGVVLSVVAYARAGGRVSPATMTWAIVAAAAGAFALFTFGTVTAGFFSDTPGHGDLAEGAHFRVVPALHPGVAWLAAPFTSALSYWLLALVTPEGGDGRAEEDGITLPAAEAGGGAGVARAAAGADRAR